MRIIFLISFILGYIVYEGKSSNYVGNITLSNQNEVNSFSSTYGSLDSITGDLEINGGLITNLNGLSSLKLISGKLQIQSTYLSNLIGLGQLEEVGGKIIIHSNPMLTEIVLNNLHFANIIEIEYNHSLNILKIDILENSERIVIAHGNLGNLNTFKKVKILNEFYVGDNPLTSILGMDSIVKINNLNLIDLTNVNDISAFSNLDSVGTMEIYNCPIGNNGLQNFTNTKFTNISLRGITNLTSLAPISNLEKIGILELDFLQNLTDVNLPKLKIVETKFLIQACNSLSFISGFDSLYKIAEFDINVNPILSSIIGFNSLKSIFNKLSIYDNPVLQDLSGLHKVKLLNTVDIQENPYLDQCCFLADLHKNNRLLSSSILFKNGQNCSDFLELLYSDCLDLDYDFRVINDNCYLKYNPNQADEDGDGIGDICDNCLMIINPDQLDTNQDGIGDLCQGNVQGENIEAKNSDIFISDSKRGVILKAANGNCYRISVDLEGNIFSTSVVCPN